MRLNSLIQFFHHAEAIGYSSHLDGYQAAKKDIEYLEDIERKHVMIVAELGFDRTTPLGVILEEIKKLQRKNKT